MAKKKAKEPEVVRPPVYPMTYFRCNDGIGGTRSDSYPMISAIHMSQQFEVCTKEEYEEAVSKYAAQRAYEKSMERPKRHEV